MKNFFLFAILILTINISVSAQSLSYELDKIREIKMLESTREDVERLLAGYEADNETDGDGELKNRRTFTSEKMEVKVSYTTGDCSDEADETDEWNVTKGKVKLIEVTFTDSVNPENLGFDLSGFKKEQTYANVENEFAYYTTDLELSIYVEDNEVEKIVIMPALEKSSSLCKNEENEEVENLRKAYSNKSIFFEPKLEDRVRTVTKPLKVAGLTLSATEIKASCSAVDPEKNKNCSNSPRIINVLAQSNFPDEEDWLVFKYEVSGGRIVGEGRNVIWDLADVKPGKYTITAGVDDGCGICGETKTQTVEVK